MKRLLLALWVASLGGLLACSPPPTPPAMSAAAASARLVGNARCPISGAAVAGEPGAPTFTATHRGRTIGFMCPACVQTFAQGTDEEKDRWLAAALESSPPTLPRPP